jgi:hypothetical protein
MLPHNIRPPGSFWTASLFKQFNWSIKSRRHSDPPVARLRDVTVIAHRTYPPFLLLRSQRAVVGVA